MEISNLYPTAYVGGNPPPGPDVEVRGGGQYESPPSSRSLEYGDPSRRQPTEQVLEGELLNEHRQGRADELRQEQRRHYEHVQQVKSASASPAAAKALEEYLTNATLNSFSFSEYSHQLDVYV